MGTLYRLIDDRNKLYYDLDKWSAPYREAIKTPAELHAHFGAVLDEGLRVGQSRRCGEPRTQCRQRQNRPQGGRDNDTHRMLLPHEGGLLR